MAATVHRMPSYLTNVDLQAVAMCNTITFESIDLSIHLPIRMTYPKLLNQGIHLLPPTLPVSLLHSNI